MFGLVTVDGPVGDRWEAGLDLIRSGDGGIRLPEVIIMRSTGGPDDDPRVQIQVISRFRIPSLTATSAAQDVSHGLRVVREVLEADPRLQKALDDFGVTWELVSDDGDRSTQVGLATIRKDGSLEWAPGVRPGE